MVKNYISVKTNDQSTLEKALFDLAELYSDTEYVHGIELYRRKKQPDSFLIQFSNNPDLDRFSYFTNYLEYPIDIDNFHVEVRGYYQTKDISNVARLKTGEWIMLYVNLEDEDGDGDGDGDGDNVYIVNEKHQNFIYDFGGRLKLLGNIIEEFKLHNINIEDYHHILDIYPSKPFIKKKDSITSAWKNVNDILVIIGCLVFTIIGIWIYDDNSKNIAIPLVLFFGFGFILLLWNYIRLKIK